MFLFYLCFYWNLFTPFLIIAHKESILQEWILYVCATYLYPITASTFSKPHIQSHAIQLHTALLIYLYEPEEVEVFIVVPASARWLTPPTAKVVNKSSASCSSSRVCCSNCATSVI